MINHSFLIFQWLSLVLLTFINLFFILFSPLSWKRPMFIQFIQFSWHPAACIPWLHLTHATCSFVKLYLFCLEQLAKRPITSEMKARNPFWPRGVVTNKDCTTSKKYIYDPLKMTNPPKMDSSNGGYRCEEKYRKHCSLSTKL